MPLKIALFSTKSYDKRFFKQCNTNDEYEHKIEYFEAALNEQTADLVRGFDAVCAFVNDSLGETVLQKMADCGVRLILMRCAGFNNVNVPLAEKLGITILRVPSYSPNAVAEHAIAMMLSLNRKIHKSYHKTREGNFTLHGLLGFDMCNKTIGVIGTGKIGFYTAKILLGFGCRVIAFDVVEDQQLKEMGVEYVPLDEVFTSADIISLHCPLLKSTHHMINAESLDKMKKGVMIINTSRGGLIETQACINALKSRKIGYLGLDVYEHEADVFFEDWSDTIMQDDMLSRLTSFPNVLLTGHQAFFTEDALCNIARTTLQNASDFETNTIQEEKQVTGKSNPPPKE